MLCYVFIILLAVVGGQSRIANDSDELRAELAKSNDKIATMDRKAAQLNETKTGK